MILKKAVQAYFDRELDDHRWVKDLTSTDLDKALAKLRPTPEFYPGLRLHQKACLLLGIAYPQFAFWINMGGGKTILSLELIRYWLSVGKAQRALVFVTSDKAIPSWTNQLEQFGIDIPYCFLDGSSEEKWETLNNFDKGIVFVTYPGAVSMCSVKIKGRRKNQMILDPQRVSELSRDVGVMVLDESTRVGHNTSLTHKLADMIRQREGIACYALAGRPFGRDPTMLWSQMYVVDRGQTFGATLGVFRSAFFKAKKNRFAKNAYVMDYTFDKKTEPKLNRMLQHRSITYSVDELLDLPKLVPIREVISLPEEAEAYYSGVVDGVKAAKGNFREMKNAFIRLRQISSGFLGIKDDETGERAEIEFLENPKLERLLELLEEVPEDSKAVVFYEFTYSGRKITEALEQQGKNPVWLWSGTKDSIESFQKFLKDPSCRVAVINSRVGAYSLDGMQNVSNYVFMYESPVPCIDREQAEARLHRDGQTKPVFQYDLIVSRTADAKILSFHKEGKDLFKAVMADPSVLEL